MSDDYEEVTVESREEWRAWLGEHHKTAPGVGSWTALDAVEELEEPADLRRALDRKPAARRHWDAFPPSTRRAILEWIGTPRNPRLAESGWPRAPSSRREPSQHGGASKGASDAFPDHTSGFAPHARLLAPRQR